MNLAAEGTLKRSEEESRQTLKSIEDEIGAASDMASYEAVDVLWLAFVKLANRSSGKKELHRMLALIETIPLEDVRSILQLPSVNTLLDLEPPLETVLSNRNERLERHIA